MEGIHWKRWDGKRVLITGVCGTVGRELLDQLMDAGPDEIIGLDNDETELFNVEQRYRENGARANLRLYLCDVRDRTNLDRKMEGIDIVLHTAAFKHVILCERSPRDAVQTNIHGTQNVIDAALSNEVERVLFTSTDKAVNPTSVMGTSKLMGERLMTAANALRRNDRPIFASTRFGNVLGSRGSVIPIFRDQIAQGGPVTLTHPDMTRFIMTLEEAVRLVLDTVFLARGGEVFVTKMPAIRIPDLAGAMIDLLSPEHGHAPDEIEVELIGTKPGEKMYEELINEEEVRRTLELDRYYVVVPAFKSPLESVDYSYPDQVADEVDKAYNSANMTPMTRDELRRYLLDHELLGVSGNSRDPSPESAATLDMTEERCAAAVDQ